MKHFSYENFSIVQQNMGILIRYNYSDKNKYSSVFNLEKLKNIDILFNRSPPPSLSVVYETLCSYFKENQKSIIVVSNSEIIIEIEKGVKPNMKFELKREKNNSINDIQKKISINDNNDMDNQNFNINYNNNQNLINTNNNNNNDNNITKIIFNNEINKNKNENKMFLNETMNNKTNQILNGNISYYNNYNGNMFNNVIFNENMNNNYNNYNNCNQINDNYKNHNINYITLNNNNNYDKNKINYMTYN